MKEVLPKVELYIISMVFVFALLLANKIPLCWGDDCHLLGWADLINWHNKVLVFSTLMIVVAVVCHMRFNYRVVHHAPDLPKTITEISNVQFETLAFLATYIIPLVSFDLDFNLDAGRNFWLFLMILVLIGAIYVRTNLYYTNPTLAVLGYRVYRVDTEMTKGLIVIVRGRLKKGDTINVVKIEEDVHYAKLAS